MSVKTTVWLNREAAVNRWVEAELTAQGAKLKQLLRQEAEDMDDDMLERELEILNDEAAGGEGFENYRISFIVP